MIDGRMTASWVKAILLRTAMLLVLVGGLPAMSQGTASIWTYTAANDTVPAYGANNNGKAAQFGMVHEGQLYVSSYNGHVYQLDLATGALQNDWLVAAYRAYSAPLMVDGSLYVFADRTFARLDTNPAVTVPLFEVPAPGTDRPEALAYDPATGLFFLSGNEKVYAVDATGDHKWTLNHFSYAWGQAMFADGYLYCFDSRYPTYDLNDRKVYKYAVSVSGPTQIWASPPLPHVPTAYLSRGTDGDGDSVVFVVGWEGETSETGSLASLYDTGPDAGTFKWNITNLNHIIKHASLWEGEDLLVIPAMNGKLVWRQASTGAFVRESTLSGGISPGEDSPWQQVVISGDYGIVGSHDGSASASNFVFVIDLNTGAELWRSEPILGGGAGCMIPIVSDGIVVYGQYDLGRWNAFKPGTGNPYPFSGFANPRSNGNAPGALISLDEETTTSTTTTSSSSSTLTSSTSTTLLTTTTDSSSTSSLATSTTTSTSTTSTITSSTTTAPGGGLVAYFPLDDATATTTVLEVQSGYHGTLNENTALHAVPGIQGGALSFDGIDDWVSITSVPTSTAWTVAWYQYVPTNGAPGNGQLGFGVAQPRQFYFSYRTDIHKRYEFISDAGSPSDLYFDCNYSAISGYPGGASFAFDHWIHYALTYEAPVAQLFVNGALAKTTNFINTVFFPSTIARAYGSVPVYGYGYIDEARIYNRVLASNEVQALLLDPSTTTSTTSTTTLTSSTSTTSTSSTSSSTSTAPVGGLVAYFRMDDNAANSTVTDSHGGYHGTMNENTAPHSVPGVLGNALRFDGVDDFVDIAGVPDLTTWTLAWFQKVPSAGAPLYNQLGFGNDTYREFYLFYRLDLQHRFELIADAPIGSGKLSWTGWEFSTFPDYGETFQMDVWTHYAITHDSTGAKLYINGNPSSANPTNTTDHFPDTIGKAEGSATEYGFGDIDEARIYDRVLTQAEIAELLNPTDPPPVWTGPLLLVR